VPSLHTDIDDFDGGLMNYKEHITFDPLLCYAKNLEAANPWPLCVNVLLFGIANNLRLREVIPKKINKKILSKKRSIHALVFACDINYVTDTDD
jgi:hypothetical protein